MITWEYVHAGIFLFAVQQWVSGGDKSHLDGRIWAHISLNLTNQRCCWSRWSCGFDTPDGPIGIWTDACRGRCVEGSGVPGCGERARAERIAREEHEDGEGDSDRGGPGGEEEVKGWWERGIRWWLRGRRMGSLG